MKRFFNILKTRLKWKPILLIILVLNLSTIVINGFNIHIFWVNLGIVGLLILSGIEILEKDNEKRKREKEQLEAREHLKKNFTLKDQYKFLETMGFDKETVDSYFKEMDIEEAQSLKMKIMLTEKNYKSIEDQLNKKS